MVHPVFLVSLHIFHYYLDEKNNSLIMYREKIIKLYFSFSLLRLIFSFLLYFLILILLYNFSSNISHMYIQSCINIKIANASISLVYNTLHKNLRF